MEQKKSFWTTIPGILTGVAAIITSLTTGYIALKSSGPDKPPSPGVNAKSPPSFAIEVTRPSDWPLIAEETFTQKLSNDWSIDNFPTEETPRFDLRLVDGSYRWDIEYSKRWYRWVICPIGSAINFNYSVDVKLVESSLHDTAISLLFGDARDIHYIYSVSANGYYGLHKYNIGSDDEETLIDWTPINNEFKLYNWNRMGVVVDGQRIRLYFNSELQGEFRDVSFTGGKVGLGVTMYEEGVSVVDFDNLQFRRKP